MKSLPPGAGGYAIGTRTQTAIAIKKRNEQLAKKDWMQHIPDDPRALVQALAEAGVDLNGLRQALQ